MKSLVLGSNGFIGSHLVRRLACEGEHVVAIDRAPSKNEVVIPSRVGIVWLHRRFIRGESPMGSLRVAAALTLTLIFTLVLASILRERFHISDALHGGLLIYAGMSTMLPVLFVCHIPQKAGSVGREARSSHF